MPPVVRRSRREAGKSPLLIGCWKAHRGPLVYDLRALGVSLWQPIPYAEAELLTTEIVGDRDSRLHQAVMAAEAERPAAPEQVEAEAETMADYRAKYFN